jgi:signal peptidase II
MSKVNGWRWLYLSLSIVALDQLTKELILERLVPYESVVVLPVLDITLLFNTGAAFSFLANAGGWQRIFFTVLAMLVSVVILIWLRRLDARTQVLQSCGLALILGGAIGNVIDRIRLGHVVDFIHVHWQQAYFPAFNVADAAITVGAGLLLLDAFLEGRRAKRDHASPAG